MCKGRPKTESIRQFSHADLQKLPMVHNKVDYGISQHTFSQKKTTPFGRQERKGGKLLDIG